MTLSSLFPKSCSFCSLKEALSVDWGKKPAKYFRRTPTTFFIIQSKSRLCHMIPLVMSHDIFCNIVQLCKHSEMNMGLIPVVAMTTVTEASCSASESRLLSSAMFPVTSSVKSLPTFATLSLVLSAPLSEESWVKRLSRLVLHSSFSILNTTL